MLLSPMLYVALLAPALADEPKDLIVGKWLTKEKQGDVEAEVTLEFGKDGSLKATVKAGMLDLKLEGTYKIVGDDKLDLEIKQGDKVQKDSTKFKVTKDKLTLTDKKGKAADYTRVPK